MILRIILVFVVALSVKASLFGQTKSYSDILPKNVQANPILDSTSYLPDSLRKSVISILKSKGFDLTKCFVDKEIDFNEKEKTISIRIWDVDDLKYRKHSEKSKKNIPDESTHSGFYSGSIEYDIKTKAIKFYGDQ